MDFHRPREDLADLLRQTADTERAGTLPPPVIARLRRILAHLAGEPDRARAATDLRALQALLNKGRVPRAARPLVLQVVRLAVAGMRGAE
ncbi:MAG: hypothetical protein JWM27_75 [Gemmatimonadetes bacterium]|nr:hypothetical protein [Gemmatimonadota bacterium]